MKKLFLLVLCLTLVLSCSKDSGKNYSIEVIDGIKVIKNTNIPSIEDLVISAKEIFRIEGIDDSNEGTAREMVWPRFLDTDSKGNIFIIDMGSSSVKKFDKNGKFIKSFGSKGTGPGELDRPFMIALLNDIVFVAGSSARRISKFDTDGNYISEFLIKGTLPRYLQPLGKDKFICFKMLFHQFEKGEEQTFNLVITDSQFQDISTILEWRKRFDPASNDFLDQFTPYAVGADKIFAAENSEDLYKIKVFDFSGQLLYIIQKDYHKIPFNKFELDELNSTLEKTEKKFGAQEYQPIKSTYKKAINGMYYDKEGRLFVASSVKRNQENRYDFLVDVFKDGIFLKKIKLDIAKGHDFTKIHDEKIFFRGNRIYYINEAEAVIKVFEY